MARDKKKKSQAADRRRPIKKKTSILSTESIDWIDYKDVNLLRRFMSERAKIRARRVTGNSAQQQRAVARAIRIAREMALLPYSVRQVTHRSKGKRGDRDGGILREPRESRDSRELSELPEGGYGGPPPDASLDTEVGDVLDETAAPVEADTPPPGHAHTAPPPHAAPHLQAGDSRASSVRSARRR